MLLRPSVDSVRRLMAVTFLAARDPAGALSREFWRQLHQTRAFFSHYKRRGDPVPYYLLM